MRSTIFRRVISVVAAAGVIATSAIFAPAAAMAAPGNAATVAVLPEPVRADALPTVQLDSGVAWTQVVVGNTVYVGGEFSNARPAGAAKGTNLSPRSNILAYDIRTGNLITSFAPVINNTVRGLAITPDGSRLVVVGNFTKVNGLTRNRIAVFDLPSGALSTTVVPSLNGPARAVAATNSKIFVGGTFSSANNVQRVRVAAFDMSKTGVAAVLPFNPDVPDGGVQAMVLNPDGSQIVASGNFTTVNGSSQPGYGMARMDTTSGQLLPLPANDQVRNGGTNSGIMTLSTDGTNFYGGGWHYGPGGNLEGAFSARWSDGGLTWIEDCHGDTYAVAAVGDLVYEASHKHYCGNGNGFPETNPRSYKHSTVVTKSVEGVNTPDIYGYPDHPGTPRPEMLNWYPQTDIGTYTGIQQAVWSVAGNSDYVVYGGEFPRVNGVGQYGLVRYATRPIAPNKAGPVLNTVNWVPQISSPYGGAVRFGYTTNWDRDDTKLTYRVYRGSETAANIVDERVVDTTFWRTQGVSVLATDLPPGSSQRFRVTATDPDGNVAKSNWVAVTVSDKILSDYAKDVIADGAVNYWRLGEDSGTTSSNIVGAGDLTLSGDVTRGAAGAIIGDSDLATTFSNGSSSTPTAVKAPDSFTVESWFKTTTTSGGKIIGFGNDQNGNSSSYDRQVYMDDFGRLWFGVYPGDVRTVNSASSFNDGEWHHVVATLGADGMKLYVDGVRVARRTDTTSGQPFDGYWRVGGDNLGGWPSEPSSTAFDGDIDDVAVYGAPITATQVAEHYTESGRTVTEVVPTDAYGSAVYQSDPELFWRFDESDGSSLVDSGAQRNGGGLAGSYTRTDGGAIAGGFGRALNFTGGGGNAFSNARFSSPGAFSLETWFSTTTTRGGKVIGFGSEQTGGSESYDRHVYMRDDGKLVFGTWTGQLNTVTTSKSYNDGQWHYVVATQSDAGLKLYVDGELAGSDPQTSAQDYSGYWRAGGDNTWGSSSPNLVGSLDEVAVYSRALSAAEIAGHFTAGGGQAPNAAPTAEFTSTVTDLTVAFDASGSTDADGAVSSYAWTFGDGTTGTGRTVSHPYAAAGTYPVVLTVTDDKGATSSTTQTITVVAPNVAPSAAFSWTAQGLTTAFDASTSVDPDGGITSYEWTFGDGAQATGVSVSHPYAATGTYTATLTVKDASGAESTTSRSVSVVAPNVAPTAAFTATVTGSSVAFDAAESVDPDGTITKYEWDFGDTAMSEGRTVSHTYTAAGRYTATLVVTDSNGATAQVTRTVTVTPAPVNSAPSAAFTLSSTGLTGKFDGTGSTDSDGTIASHAWDFGDGKTGTGATVSHDYAAAGTYTVVLTVTDDKGATGATTRQLTVSAPPVNSAPTAAFTSTSAGLTAAFDASTSIDLDGSIVGWSWSFGDGNVGQGATVSHPYAVGGSYEVTLTVSDNAGATGSVTRTVVVTAPPTETVLGADDFERTVANGWGTATTGGAWTLSSGAVASVSGGAGKLAVAPGQTRTALLNAVSVTDASVLTSFAVTPKPSGAAQNVDILGRMVGSTAYTARVRIDANGGIKVFALRGETALGASVTLPGAYQEGQRLNVRFQVQGTSPTQVMVKVWRDGEPEPTAWTISTTDSTTAMQTAGKIGLRTYASSSSTVASATVSFYDFRTILP